MKQISIPKSVLNYLLKREKIGLSWYASIDRLDINIGDTVEFNCECNLLKRVKITKIKVPGEPGEDRNFNNWYRYYFYEV